MAQIRLGIDVGGTGIKCALVDLAQGSLVSERHREDTPQPALPETMVEVAAELVGRVDYSGPVGVGFPSVIDHGVVRTANNIDPSWIGVDIRRLFSEALGADVSVVNDADAAALAEARYGAARGVDGIVLVITFGTGIGCGFLFNGQLVPNVQIGDIELEGHRPAETYFAASAGEREDLSWEEWGGRAGRFLAHLQTVFAPERIVVGGGVVSDWREWARFLPKDLPVVPTESGKQAGIIGAAVLVGGS